MASPRQHRVSHQPWKAVYTLYAVTLTLAKLPFYLAYFTIPRLRQHSKWTYRQALMNKLFKIFLYHATVVEVHTPLSLNPDAEKQRFIQMKPASTEMYRDITHNPDIEPSTVGGTWYPNPYELGDQRSYNIVLHFHGGAYAMCEGREGDSGFAAKLLVEHVAAKALFPSYRLASSHSGKFIAALQDAITSYQYLLSLGIHPNKITLSGDSAGGNLVIALLRYIANSASLLPSPSAALLWSLVTDLEAARDPMNLDRNRNSKTDFLPGNFCAWGAIGVTADAPSSARPYFTPRSYPFSTSVPLWIQIGGLEALYDEGMEFADSMRQHGNTVHVYVEPYTNHDIFYLGNNMGFTAEAVKVAKLAGGYIKSQRE